MWAQITMDMSIPLGTVIHLLGTVVIISGAYWRLAVRQQWQHNALVAELREIKERVGCVEEEATAQGEKGTSLAVRLRGAEKDIEWLMKSGGEKRP